MGNSLQGPWLPAGSWSLCPLQHSIQLVPAQITKLKRENHTQPQTLPLTGSYLLLTPHTTTRMWTETIWFQKWVWILELGWGESWYHHILWAALGKTLTLSVISHLKIAGGNKMYFTAPVGRDE